MGEGGRWASLAVQEGRSPGQQLGQKPWGLPAPPSTDRVPTGTECAKELAAGHLGATVAIFSAEHQTGSHSLKSLRGPGSHQHPHGPEGLDQSLYLAHDPLSTMASFLFSRIPGTLKASQ